MAIGGAPWDVDTDIILNAIKASRGCISHACKALHVRPATFYARMANEPVIQQVVKEERNAYDLSLLDESETTLHYALVSREKDLTNSLKSAIYVLNNKGAERGYSPKNSPGFQEKTNLSELAEASAKLAIEKVKATRDANG